VLNNDRSLLIGVFILGCLMVTWAQVSLRPFGPNDKEFVAANHWAENGMLAMNGAFVIQLGSLTPAELENPPRFRGHFFFNAVPYHLFQTVTNSPVVSLLLACLLWTTLVTLAVCSLQGSPALKALLLLGVFCSPAVLRELSSLDPVAGSLFWSLPALVWLFACMANPSARPPQVLLAGIAAVVAMSLNWTSAIALAVWAPLLLFYAWPSKAKLFAFFLIGLIASSVFIFLALDKLHSASIEQITGYLAGAGGSYGMGTSTVVSLRRVFVSCGIGLLPVWVALACVVVGFRQRLPEVALVFLPSLFSVIIVVVLLRNYASHAQWVVAGPIVLNGLVASFAAVLLMQHSKVPAVPVPEMDSPRRTLRSKLALITLATLMAGYGGFFILLFAAFGSQLNHHIKYVLAHTHANDMLVVSPYDSSLGRAYDDGFLMMSYFFPRECVLPKSARLKTALASGRKVFHFTTNPALGDRGLPRSENTSSFGELLDPFFKFYQARVTGREQSGLSYPGSRWLLIPYNGEEQ
jgi:hypothetical protein